MKYLECAGSEGGCRVEQYEKFVQDRMRVGITGKGDNGNHREPEDHNYSIHQSSSPNENAGELNDDGRYLPASISGSNDDDQEPPTCVSGSGDANVGVQSQSQSHRESTTQSTENASSIALDTSSPIEESDDRSPDHPPEPQPEMDVLEQLNIEVHGMTFEDYNRTVLTEQEIFDLVISDPFQKPASAQTQEFSSERRVAFIQFIKKVLVPGGHAFLMLPQLEMSEWVEAFEIFEMKTEGMFLLLKDPEHAQRVKGKSFQNLMEVAAVARKPGRHPTRFTMDTVSPYTQLPRNTYKRKAPVIDNISPPSNRLRFPRSKALVRTAEKSPALFWELMKTFCPAGGKVPDPVAATLTVGIAGIQTGRSCVLLESDRQCLTIAQERLRELATKQLEDGEAFEQSLISGPVEIQKECHGFTEDAERQDEISSNDEQGDIGTEVTMPSQDPEHILVENLQSAEKEDSCEQQESEGTDRSVYDSDEINVSRGVSRKAGSEECFEPSLRGEVPNAAEVLTRKANRTTPGQVAGTSKAKTNADRDCVLDLQNNPRRPQRNRKKTARYA